MNEVIAAVLGALVGGVLTYAGARSQARAAIAQAESQRGIAVEQLNAVRQQWAQSSRAHACAELLQASFEFEEEMTLIIGLPDQEPIPWRFLIPSPRHWSPASWSLLLYRIRAHANRRLRRHSYQRNEDRQLFYKLCQLARPIERLERACSFAQLYGPTPLAHQAEELLQCCKAIEDQAATFVQDYTGPRGNWFIGYRENDLRPHIPRVQTARHRFAETARHYLDDISPAP
ncbi:hypothetical protein ACFY12_25180 [Streptomyces sp. NPDC001339]|uniref:hypothetical protein n=1 Tax=Streptomyces sp. NPDC001339 TaxID=3364563 RepID=UPI0036ACB8B3